MDIQNSKSILAKLMAQEDLTVVHNRVATASFDTKNRVLTLPIWQDMNGDLYDLLTGHEVGHALYTPDQGWHDAIVPDGNLEKVNHVLKGYLNVLEDARIEKKIKSRYPGLRSNFYRAYQGLHEKDFFRVSDKPIADLMLIDRINLHFKLGSFIAVPFSEQEKSVVRRVENLETWAEVEALARELMAKAQQELEDRQEQLKKKLRLRIGAGQMSDDADGGDDGDDINFDDYDEIEFEVEEGVYERLSQAEQELLDQQSVASETDRAFRDNEDTLLDHTSRPYEYVTVPSIKAAPFIVGYRSIMEQMVFNDDQESFRAATYAAFRKKNDRVVDYLVKEFELKRNAQQLMRAKVSKSGEIDVKKVFSYQYNEDLFRRVTSMPNGKNHGLIMLFDMSGSMSTQMGAVIEQMLVLVEFCRKVNIPFEVYGFSNNGLPGMEQYQRDLEIRQPTVVGEVHVADHSFTLRQYFTDKMRPTEYKKQITNLTLLSRIWNKRACRWNGRSSIDNIDLHCPDSEELNGTPLNQSLMVTLDVYRSFVERTKAEIVNIAVLTDGDTDGYLQYGQTYKNWSGDEQIALRNIRDSDKVNVVLTHKESRKSVKLESNDRRATNGLVKLIREVTGANVVCFDIVSGNSRRVISNKMFKHNRSLTPAEYQQTEILAKKFRKERVLVLENLGYNEYYLIPGGKELDIDDDEIEVESGADKKKLLKAFAEMQDNKKTSRILLNRFVKMVA